MKKSKTICLSIILLISQQVHAEDDNSVHYGISARFQDVSVHEFFKGNFWLSFINSKTFFNSKQRDLIASEHPSIKLPQSCWSELPSVNIPYLSNVAILKIESKKINNKAADIFNHFDWLNFREELLPVAREPEFIKKNLDFYYGLNSNGKKRTSKLYDGTFLINYDGAYVIEIIAIGDWRESNGNKKSYWTKKVSLTFKQNPMTGSFGTTKEFTNEDALSFEEALCQAARNRIVGK